MSRAKNIQAAVIHTTGGNGTVQSNEDWWRTPKAKGGPGWSGKGYNVIVDLQGVLWFLINPTAKYGYSKVYDAKCWEFITNGVGGWNNQIVSISYIGGVGGIDTRTDEQKAGLLIALKHWMDWMLANGGDLANAQIDGHFHYSKDKNGNGIIDPWEKSKTCPNFDAHIEYRWLMQTGENPANELPKK
jgi:N-acetylmuramoyl-L-alanine amidase